jgi:hypothetical protein
LWPIIEGSHKIRSSTISVLFFAHKLVTAASKKHIFSHHNSMQLYFTVVFGVAIGMLSTCKSSKVIDKSTEERDTFLKKAEGLSMN